MLNISQGPMNSIQIMNILNNNMIMKYITYTLIQNPLIMNQMMNILNSLYYNQMLMIEIKNLMNQEINMMNWKIMVNPMMGNLGLNNKFDELKQNNKITIIFKKKLILILSLSLLIVMRVIKFLL